MGSRWWLEIAFTYSEGTKGDEQLIKIRITCESHEQDSLEPNTIEREYLAAADLSRACNGSKLFGYVEAIIPRYSIQRFRDG